MVTSGLMANATFYVKRKSITSRTPRYNTFDRTGAIYEFMWLTDATAVYFFDGSQTHNGYEERNEKSYT